MTSSRRVGATRAGGRWTRHDKEEVRRRGVGPQACRRIERDEEAPDLYRLQQARELIAASGATTMEELVD